jgi:hypothetical protein
MKRLWEELPWQYRRQIIHFCISVANSVTSVSRFLELWYSTAKILRSPFIRLTLNAKCSLCLTN